MTFISSHLLKKQRENRAKIHRERENQLFLLNCSKAFFSICNSLFEDIVELKRVLSAKALIVIKYVAIVWAFLIPGAIKKVVY